MDIASKLIQSGSVVRGVHWGKVIDDTPVLIIVKPRVVEIHNINEHDQSMYCILEQYLGFEVNSSALHRLLNRDLLVAASSQFIYVLEFDVDYFKIRYLMETGLFITKIQPYGDYIVISKDSNTIHMYKYQQEILYRAFEDFSTIIDWTVCENYVIVLEHYANTLHWVKIQPSNPNSITKNWFNTNLQILCFIVYDNTVLAFSEDSICVLEFANLSSRRVLDIEGIFYTHTIHKNRLYIITDIGKVYEYSNYTVKEIVSIEADSLILALDRFIFGINPYGLSYLFEDQVLKEFGRSGAIIDAVVMPVNKALDYKSLYIGSIQGKNSSLYALYESATVCITRIIPKISKLSNNAAIIDNHLCLMPDLKVINIQTYELINLSSLGLVDDKTLSLSKLGGRIIQITEQAIHYASEIKYQFQDSCFCSYIKDDSVCVGLLSQSVLYFYQFELIYRVENLDFSAIYISDKVYIGLQTSELKAFDFKGKELDGVDILGIPHSYL